MLPIAQALAVELGCEPVVIAEEDRAAYAEAIATATEFSRSIVQQAAGAAARRRRAQSRRVPVGARALHDRPCARRRGLRVRRVRPHRYDQRMISTIDGLRTRLAEARAAAPDGARVALISTIGALHDGHIDLVHRAREVADIVVVSVFVNPLRFANVAEFEAYPRTPDDDERLLASLGVDVVFAPDADGAAAARHRARRRSAPATSGCGTRGGRARSTSTDCSPSRRSCSTSCSPDVAIYGERDRQRIFLVDG